jgi:hypothetical protein
MTYGQEIRLEDFEQRNKITVGDTHFIAFCTPTLDVTVGSGQPYALILGFYTSGVRCLKVSRRQLTKP